MSFYAGLENHNNLPEVKRPLAEYYANKGRRKLKEELIGWEPVIQKEVRKRQPNIVYYCIYVESRKMGLIKKKRKMGLMNLFVGQE